MSSTYPTQFTNDLIDYLSFNMVAFLINRNQLGLSHAPTQLELTSRRDLIMSTAASFEVGAVALNGYRRAIVTPVEDPQDPNNLTLTASFTAAGGAIGPFTHICFARGASLVGANSANGNNRGNLTGSLIFVESVATGSPLAARTVSSGTTFTFSKPFTISAGLSD